MLSAAAPLANQIIGKIQGDLTRAGSPLGESTLGDVIADAQYEATKTAPLGGAQLAFMNPGGCGGQTAPKTLQISSTLKYESIPAAATCAAKVGRMWVSGVLVNPTDTFRVTMNNFIATGGDGFTVFNEGTNALGGAQDIDAFKDYFAANNPAGIAVPPLNRIVPAAP